MDFYIFNKNGDYVGMRGSLPNEEENLTAVEQNAESLQKMANYLNPKLISGEIIETATNEEIQQYEAQRAPTPISQMRFRLALIQFGINLQDVYTFIENIPDQTTRQIAYVKWEYAQEYDRNDPMLNSLAEAFGISQEQLTQIFIIGNE